MKNFLKVLAGSTAALALASVAAPASAAVYISLDGVNPIATLTDLDDGTIGTGNICAIMGVNCGGFESVSVTGSAPVTGKGRLHTNAVEVNAPASANGASVTVYVTRTGVVLGTKQFLSYSNNNQGGRIQTSLQQFYSGSGQLFGGTPFEAAFNSNINGANSKNSTLSLNLVGGTYSVTQKYVITAAADSVNERSASPTMTLAVPEPGTWALMIMGFGGAGAMVRSRRKVLATAA